jgi:uncharacterized protein (TIGR03435 family)
MRVVTSLAFFVSGVVCAQSGVPLRFEVASVKPSTDQSSGSSGGKSGHGRLTLTNATLKRCIMGAYGLGPNLIAGGPDWLDSDRFEIVAKSEQSDGDEVLMKMLQTLLAERFKLAVHRETRTIRAYVLEVAKNGPKLDKAKDDNAITRNGRGLIDAKAISMIRFAEVLSRQMDLPVVNQTGLEGAFDLKLEWDSESEKKVKLPADIPSVESGPSLFTAIQQQLGLRLSTLKTPVEVLVIDHAEKPSEN